MKFIGNKFRLLDFISSVLENNNIKDGTLMDLFAGTANVGRHFKRLGYKIISTDILEFSYAFQKAFIEINDYPKFDNLKLPSNIKVSKCLDDFILNNNNDYDRILRLKKIICYLNTLQGEEGFIYRNYSEGGTLKDTYKRRYFSDSNARRIDTIRNKLEYWKNNNLINENEFYLLLSELIDKSDYVANNSGTYGAYLKIWRSMALKPLILEMPQVIRDTKNHEVYKLDANKLVRLKSCDIAYIDPPYNSRQYSANYHLLETIACWDNPKIYGKTGLRPHKDKDSDYSIKRKATKAFQDLIDNLDAKHILVSYNNEGLIPHNQIIEILESKGEFKLYEKEYRRYRSESNHEKRNYKEVDDKTTEYIYYCKVE